MSPTQTLVAPAILRDPTGLPRQSLRPGEHDWQPAIWNGMINRLRPSGTRGADVIGVDLARKEGCRLRSAAAMGDTVA